MSTRTQSVSTGLQAHLGGFNAASNRRIAAAAAVTVAAVAGWAFGGHLVGWRWGQWGGAGVGATLAALLVVVPWLGQSAWSWLQLRLQGRRTNSWSEPFTVANNRSGGGVRIEGAVAVVAVQLLGKAHAPTIVTGSTRVETANVVDVAVLHALMRQPLGLTLHSHSTVIAGSRRSRNGDYARVYDTLIGTTQYGGRRESWLILRLNVIDNAEAFGWRTSVGAAAIAVAHRVAGSLRCSGLRAKVGTATDLTALDQRLGVEALTPERVQWKQIRTQDGWLTSYAYPANAIRAEVLAEAWTMPVDEVIQNVTVFADGTCTATVTVRTPQPLVAPPNVVLRPLYGEQAAVLASAMCGPLRRLRGVPVGVLPERLELEIGPSGVLLGKLRNGDRLLVPLTDGTEPSRVFISGEDPIVKRLVIRAQGSGDRLSVHTRDRARWASVRMPDVVVVGEPRPAPRSTISVIDGVLAPNPRPNTVITVAPPGALRPALAGSGPAKVQLPNNQIVTAPNSQIASVTKLVIQGTPIPDAFDRNGMAWPPPPGTPVSTPIDQSHISMGAVGQFADRQVYAIDKNLIVVDGQIKPISEVSSPGFLGWMAPPDVPSGTADVCIEQINGALAKVSVGDQEWMVDMELFRAENRYCTLESVGMVRPPR